MLQELLDQHEISQSELARHLKTSHAYINDVCRGRRSVTIELALKLGQAFRQNPKFWIDLQANWDLRQAGTKKIGPVIRKRAK